jgi:hypothetical protein
MIFADPLGTPSRRGEQTEVDSAQSSRKAQINHVVPVPGGGLPVTYFVGAPHPPSERQTDAGQLPPWLLGVALFTDFSAAYRVPRPLSASRYP